MGSDSLSMLVAFHQRGTASKTTIQYEAMINRLVLTLSKHSCAGSFGGGSMKTAQVVRCTVYGHAFRDASLGRAATAENKGFGRRCDGIAETKGGCPSEFESGPRLGGGKS